MQCYAVFSSSKSDAHLLAQQRRHHNAPGEVLLSGSDVELTPESLGEPIQRREP
jgi:hypothetical protein